MGKERILIVDDEVEWTELVKVWLNKAGYMNIQTALSGNEALEIAMRETPDCIILDLVLPDISGTEFCKKVRSIPVLSRVPIIMFTGHKNERVLGLQSGADYFVGKSENPNELLASLQALFRRREMDYGVIKRGELMLRSLERQVYYQGELVATLTPKMFTLLYALVQRSPEPVSKNDLYKLVEGVDNEGLSKALDILLNRLRKALPKSVTKNIVNVKNFGYVYIPTDSENTHKNT